MKKIYKNNEKKLEEFYNAIDDIASTSQSKFTHEIENLTYNSLQEFRKVLAKELNSIFKNIHSQNVNLLKSTLIDYAVSSNFITKKGEAALIRSLLNAAVHTIKDL